jgi:uncharacterized membrane protein
VNKVCVNVVFDWTSLVKVRKDLLEILSEVVILLVNEKTALQGGFSKVQNLQVIEPR